MKKVTALFLAMLMCMALAVPALAVGVGSGDSISSGDDEASHTVAYTAKVQEPTISVTVPSRAQNIILNPYQIKVTNTMSTASGTAIGTAVGSGGSAASQASVLSTVLYLHNKSTAPLKMTLKLHGEIPDNSGVAFSEEAVTDEEQNKRVFLFADVGTSQETLDNPVALSNPRYSGNDTQGVFRNGDVTLTEVATLKVPQVPANGNYLPIQIGGNCTKSPTNGWKDADKVEISLIFTFQATNNDVA